MTTEQFARERRYAAAIALVKSLHAREEITDREYKEIRQMFVQKYQPLLA